MGRNTQLKTLQIKAFGMIRAFRPPPYSLSRTSATILLSTSRISRAREPLMTSLLKSESAENTLLGSRPLHAPVMDENETLRAALDQCGTEIRDGIQAALAGQQLSFDDALSLANVEGPALDALVAAANVLRRHTVGDTISYVVNRNINFTNVCFVGCSFCG